MNKLILFILLCLPVIASAQKFDLDGFWGINFKSNKETCKAEVLKRYGLKPDASSNAGTLIYKNAKFANHKTEGVLFGFLNDQLFMGVVILVPETEQKILDLYYAVVHELGMKYHAANESKYGFIYPFSKDDSEGQKLLAIKGGYSEIWSKWKFDAGQGLENNTIDLELNKDGYLKLTYLYGPINAVFSGAQQKLNAAEY